MLHVVVQNDAISDQNLLSIYTQIFNRSLVWYNIVLYKSQGSFIRSVKI